MATSEMIRVDELTKDYAGRVAIDRISFHAKRGEILGFLGPNGAGKTTTMRILTGYMPPTSGSARVVGFDVVDESLEVRRRVGYLPETVPLYPDMVVFDYLKFMADLRHVPNATERVEEVLEIVHMLDRADGYIGKLSKGFHQRVGLAQALLHEPEVLILDEPTIGLDPAQIVEVRRLISQIGRERTVLLSTHILSEAQQVCDRILIINKGRIVAEDTPARLQSHLTGFQRILIRVRGDGERFGEAISGVPGVANVQANRDGRWEVSLLPGQDVRPEVARVAVEAGYDLLEMSPVSLSLEDIFMQLTRDEEQVTRLPGDLLSGEEPEPEPDSPAQDASPGVVDGPGGPGA